MNTAVTLRKLAAVAAGLVLAATASTGHAQQEVAEAMLERQLQEQQLAGESANKNSEQKREKGAENPEKEASEDIDVSDTYNDEGDPII